MAVFAQSGELENSGLQRSEISWSQILSERIPLAEFNKENLAFNCLVSLGEACRPAEHLKRNNLRFFSSPLDWMMSYNLEAFKKLRLNGVEGFFHNRELVRREAVYNVIRDKDTGMVSMHHFPVKEDPDQYYNFFLKLMDARHNIMMHYIRNASSLGFICNARKLDELQKFKSFVDEMFKKDCRILNIINCRNVKPAYTKENNIYCFYFEDINPIEKYRWLGNVVLWSQILSSIKLA